MKTIRQSKFRVVSLLLLLILSMGHSTLLNLHAEERDAEYLAGLRARGLFSLAEIFCNESLARPDLSEKEKAELTIELSRVLAERALNAKNDRANALWDQAVQIPDEFTKANGNNPRVKLISAQAALVLLSRGETLRLQSEVSRENEETLKNSRIFLGQSIKRLETLIQETSTTVRLTPAQRRKGVKDFLTESEQLALNFNLQYQIARALQNLGQTYPDNSADRTDSMNRAVTYLKMLSDRPDAEITSWQSRLDLIRCARAKGLLDDALNLLNELHKSDPPDWITEPLTIEAVKILLANNQPAEALEIAKKHTTEKNSPEFDFALLSIHLKLWQNASEKKDQAKTIIEQQKVSQLVAKIRSQYQPYWGRRAVMAEAFYLTKTGSGTNDVAALTRAAENYFNSGKITESIASYDRASQSASAANDLNNAFKLGFTAAAICYQSKQFDSARDRFLVLAKIPHPQAGYAHLSAIQSESEIQKLKTSDQDLTIYATLLNEHITKWPLDQEGLWLAGRYYQSQKKWKEAIQAFRGIRSDNKHFNAAITAMSQSTYALLKQSGQTDLQKIENLKQAATDFEVFVFGPERRWPEKWSDGQRVAALEAARLWIHPLVLEYARAEKLLSAAIKNAATADAKWRTNARQTLITVYVGQGRFADAETILNEVQSAEPDTFLAMLESLDRALSPENLKDRKIVAAIAKLQIQSVDLLRKSGKPLTEKEQLKLNLIYASALERTGQAQRAGEILKDLSSKNKDRGDIQHAYAMHLSRQGSREHLERALKKWKEIETRNRQGTTDWFDAKYYLAEIHYRLGKKDLAKKIVTVTEIIYPKLGGDVMKKKFDKLKAVLNK
jgi:tetratricopeptide (TPR) repeat protein